MEKLKYSKLKLLCTNIHNLAKRLTGHLDNAQATKPLPPNSSSYVATRVEAEEDKMSKRSQNQMVSPKLFNREVYMLIDQSGSMSRRDRTLGGKMRWAALQEVIEGHVFRILNEKNPMDGTPICEEILATFFSPNVPCPKNLYIQDTEQVEEIFQSNLPDQNTFITPTLEKVINLWKDRGRNQGKGAHIIIYVDGQFDDRDNFLNLIESTCKGLHNQDELKIVILGYGSEFEGCNPNVEFYVKLDLNTSDYTDSKGSNCNIVVFDLIPKLESIIDPLNRQLDDPLGGLASWTKTECPQLFK